MIRTQVQLTDKLAAGIKDLAVREHLSMAEMIRRAVARFLESESKAGKEDRYARALSAAGGFTSGSRRNSTRHDAEFAEASQR